MKSLNNTPVGDIVAQNYKTAVVFTKHGIDFCCNGHRTLAEACTKKGLDAESLYPDLERLLLAEDPDTEAFMKRSLTQLTEHIEKVHHTYVEQQIPVLKQYLEKLVKVHGNRYSEIPDIADLFNKVATELITHMKKEEIILFPAIRRLEGLAQTGKSPSRSHIHSLENPIRMMEHEHDSAGELMRQIRNLSNNFTAPEQACATHRVAWALLHEFEEDLHLHIHLENNILFPGAQKLEKELVTIS